MSNFVRQYPNALNDQVCDNLIEWFESPNSDSAKTVSANRETRKDTQKWMMVATTSHVGHKLYKCLQAAKKGMLQNYMEEFPIAYRGKRRLKSDANKIQRTEPFGGGFHNFHAEVSHHENMDRCVVWTFYLNDMPEGEGETEFLYEKIRVQPQKGLGLMFPAGWTFQHRGNPVHTHNKYIATGWWHYPAEKGYY